MLNYDRESEQAVAQIEPLISRLYNQIPTMYLMKLFFMFCIKCKGFNSAWNILENLKTIFTNSYCTLSNRLTSWELPAKELEILGIAFRGFYMKIKYPTEEIAKYQVRVFFKLVGFQMLQQILGTHHRQNDSQISVFLNKVLLFIH